VANGDRLIRSPWRELEGVETFLNLPHMLPRDSFPFNSTKVSKVIVNLSLIEVKINHDFDVVKELVENVINVENVMMLMMLPKLII
jgi:hypothetical protein